MNFTSTFTYIIIKTMQKKPQYVVNCDNLEKDVAGKLA